jgi:hypothetical protein
MQSHVPTERTLAVDQIVRTASPTDGLGRMTGEGLIALSVARIDGMKQPVANIGMTDVRSARSRRADTGVMHGRQGSMTPEGSISSRRRQDGDLVVHLRLTPQLRSHLGVGIIDGETNVTTIEDIISAPMTEQW